MAVKTNSRFFRHSLLLVVVSAGFVVMLGRVAQLQLVKKEFLQHQGDVRHLRNVEVPAHRGAIIDRHGEPLAISTPVESIWAKPAELLQAPAFIPQLADILGMDAEGLTQLLTRRQKRRFVYLKRRVNPEIAEQAMALNAPGVSLLPEYRRYYPAGEVTAHLVGFTDIDDEGQEGLELAFSNHLRGTSGEKRVIKDGRKRIVENVENIRAPRHGEDLQLSIDRRIQYLAYRELKAAVKQHGAKSGSIVVLDNQTGEVLAMANQPSYNPNNRKPLDPAGLRNRAVTDVFEPGSAIKPFVIAAALESGQYSANTVVDASNGLFQVGTHTIRDMHDYGELDLTGILSKSSNVGAARIALNIPPAQLYSVLHDAGLGVITSSGFPGEVSGFLSDYHRWRDLERATLAFGYGASVTLLQLADAYTVLANDGYRVPVSLVRKTGPSDRQQVLDAEVARSVRFMLESVVQEGGTAPAAAVDGYRVAGKTGTVHKPEAGGYSKDRYMSIFAGMAPASKPRLVIAIVINEPAKEEHFGGVVAGPAFSRVMSGALRLLNIAPDNLPLLQTSRQALEEPA
ncbi:MAG: penicillin-binding transpeptidase domain-containing protein [Gammaproteobacteria bacterium]